MSAAAVVSLLEAPALCLKGGKNGEVRDEREEAIAKQGLVVSSITVMKSRSQLKVTNFPPVEQAHKHGT